MRGLSLAPQRLNTLAALCLGLAVLALMRRPAEPAAGMPMRPARATASLASAPRVRTPLAGQEAAELELLLVPADDSSEDSGDVGPGGTPGGAVRPVLGGFACELVDGAAAVLITPRSIHSETLTALCRLRC